MLFLKLSPNHTSTSANPAQAYHRAMPGPPKPPLPLDASLLKPGLRLAVAVSGGADSIALLRVLHQQGAALGLVLLVAHLHHGLRGAEADADLDFVRALAAQLGCPFHHAHVDVAAEARQANESVEQAARRLRYAWFRQLMAAGQADAVATAHTLDDQAETVCAKFLRGAWTEGLGGIHPVLDYPEGPILRPFLGTTRAQIEAYLVSIGQPWREDSSNRDPRFTRNRIRHDLMPALKAFNPHIQDHLAQMATLARDEDAWWKAEVARIAPQVLMTGKPVRGGGRAASDDLALDIPRLAALAPALQRRLLRHAAALLGVALDFLATETIRSLALAGRAGQCRELAQGLLAERTPRELRLSIHAAPAAHQPIAACHANIPGEILAAEFGLLLQVSVDAAAPCPPGRIPPQTATLRNWKPGDRVRLRHSSAPRKVKEVLERMRVTGTGRARWPVLEVDGRIVWMQGVDLEPVPGISVHAEFLHSAHAIADPRPPAIPLSSDIHATDAG